MKLTTEKVGAQRIDIHIDSNGEFSAEFDEQGYEAKTRLELLEKLTKAVRKAKGQHTVDVTVLGIVPNTESRWSSSDPFECGIGTMHAKLRARHERQRGVYLLVTDDLGSETKRFSIGGYGTRENITLARRLTEPEVQQYLQLREAVRAAETALEDFEGSVKIDADDALAAAEKEAKP